MKTFLWNFPGTALRRRCELRIDSDGIYLLAYDWVYNYLDPWYDREKQTFETLIAGVSYQWPHWLAGLLGSTAKYTVRNNFSIFSWPIGDKNETI